MSVLLVAEYIDGEIKKSIFEAATYAHDLAKNLGTEIKAIIIGEYNETEIQKLGAYGISEIHSVDGENLKNFNSKVYTDAVEAVANLLGTNVVVFTQTYNSRALAPRVAIRLNAAMFSGVTTLVEKSGDKFIAQRSTYSTKGVETVATSSSKLVVTIKGNSYKTEENNTDISIQQFDFQADTSRLSLISKGIEKEDSELSLTEAEIVVSAGRGLKGPENWGMLEELAKLLGAATACSKPVADVGWRPHHEHVGQTGIQIAPNLYIAIGISGAIQHLAGVNSSKVIVVINNDEEAPFFKAADYGIVGDAFSVVPKLVEAIKTLKS